MLSEHLSELLLQTIESLPIAVLMQLASELEDLSNLIGTQTTDVSQTLSKISERFPNPSVRYAVDKLFDAWEAEKQNDQNSTLHELAAALGVLILSRTKEKDRRKLELVWTGPASKIPVRQTRQVLSQIIGSAQKELLIVSFVVFKIPEILELLKSALLRGVTITCVFESPEESDGKITFQGFADFDDEILRQIKILVWDKEMRPVSTDGKIGTLHAKVAVADRLVSFISSANLTVNAMTLNMELGLLLEDKITSREIVEHFEQLARNGVFKTRIIDR